MKKIKHHYKRSSNTILHLCCAMVFLFTGFSSSYAQLAFTPQGDAVNLGAGCYQLTPAAGGAAGAIWSGTNVDFTKPFLLTFSANLTPSSGSADGFVVAFGSNLTTATLPSAAGGNLGYYFGPAAYANNSFGVEFDTYDNGAGGTYCDGNADHVSIAQNSIPCPALAGPADVSPWVNIGDGATHRYRITWDPQTTTLNVYLMNGAGCDLLISTTTTDYRTFFTAPNSVPWGFTGATGSSYSNESICDVVLDVPAITGPHIVCQYQHITLTANVTGGTWSSANTGVATVGGTTGVVTGVGGGVTDITYSIPCGVDLVYSVTVNPSPSVTLTATPATICVGHTSTLVATATFGGAGPITYTWTPPSLGTASTAVVSPAITRTYTVVATAGGCPSLPAVTTVTVLYPPVVPAITGPLSICFGNTVTFMNAVPGGVWTSLGTSTIITGTGTTAGGSAYADVYGASLTPPASIIRYTVTNACGTTSVIRPVAILPLPKPKLSQFKPICVGKSFTLVGTPGFPGPCTVSWSSSNASIASVSPASGTSTVTVTGGPASGTATITYSVTSSITGCIGTVTAVVTVNPAPLPITGSHLICGIGSTTTLSSATPGGSWTSSNPFIASVDPFGVVTGLHVGNVIIRYTLPSGCDATFLVMVRRTPKPVIRQFKPLCLGSSMVVVGVPGIPPPYSVSWTSSNIMIASVAPATGSPVVVVTGTGIGTATLTFTVTSGAGCVGIATAVVTVNPLPAPITGSHVICGIGSTTTLSTTSTGGTWSSSTPAVATVDAFGVVTGVSIGAAIITYTLPSGCYTLFPVAVVRTPRPTIKQRASICVGQSITVVGSPGFTGVYTVNWSSSNSTIATVSPASGTSTVTVTGILPGTANITYSVTSALGCNGIAIMTVTVSPNPSAITGNAVICGPGVTLPLSSSPSGGVWTSSVPAVGTVDASGNVTSISAGTTTISYSIGPCPVTAVVTVEPLPAPSFHVNPGSLNRICVGQTDCSVHALAGATGSYTATFTSSDTSVATISTTSSTTACVTGIALGTTTISYTVTSAAGCVGYATYVLSVVPCISGVGVACYGTTLTATPTGGSWDMNPTSIASIDPSTGVVTPTPGGPGGTVTVTYTVSGMDAYDIVTIPAQPTACMTGAEPTYTFTGTPGDVISYQFFDQYAAPVIPVYMITIGALGTATVTVSTPPPYPPTPGYTQSICITSITSNGCVWPATVYGTCCIVLYPTPSRPAGIGEASEKVNTLSIAPNPTNGTFVITGSSEHIITAKDVSIEVFDLLGRAIYNGTTPVENGSIRATITLDDHIASGMYQLRIGSPGGEDVVRFILRK